MSERLWKASERIWAGPNGSVWLQTGPGGSKHFGKHEKTFGNAEKIRKFSKITQKTHARNRFFVIAGWFSRSYAKTDAKIEFYAKKHVYRLILSSVGLKIADLGVKKTSKKQRKTAKTGRKHLKTFKTSKNVEKR